MNIFRPNLIKEAAKEMSEAMDLLTADLNELKKRYLNGHHDIQIRSEIQPTTRKPNGTSHGGS